MAEHQPSQTPGDITSFRKLSHLEICLKEQVEAHTSAHWEDFHFVHRAIADWDLDDIDTHVTLFGKRLALPLVAAALTGGHPEVRSVNEAVARVAQKLHFGMGVGSERAAIEKNIPYVTESFKIVRNLAPDTLILGNLGAAQFSDKGKFGIEQAQQAIQLVHADVLAIHVNPAQEIVQPEGDTCFKGFFHQADRVAQTVKVPVILKEVGSGFAMEDADRIEKSLLAGVDVGGLGGTSWVGVEALRAKEKGDQAHCQLGELFWDWGIPTALSVAEVRSRTKKVIIATGGVRNGLQAAKALALGADAVGMAMPFLKFAHQGEVALENFVHSFARELKTAMFLTGCSTIEELKKVPMVVTGPSREWLQQRGITLRQTGQY